MPTDLIDKGGEPQDGRVPAESWWWWAGRNEDEYCLAGPCRTREEAINEAYGDTEPGDRIFLIEARMGEWDEFEGLYEFTHTRNRSSIIRDNDPAEGVGRQASLSLHIHPHQNHSGGPHQWPIMTAASTKRLPVRSSGTRLRRTAGRT